MVSVEVGDFWVCAAGTVTFGLWLDVLNPRYTLVSRNPKTARVIRRGMVGVAGLLFIAGCFHASELAPSVVDLFSNLLFVGCLYLL